MTKQDMLNKLSQAKSMLTEVTDYIQSLEDNEEKLSIFAELYDAENYTNAAISKIEKHYEKLKAQN